MTVLPRDFGPLAGTGWRAATGTAFAAGGKGRAVDWQVAEEVPVAILYNSRSYAVMMATPADLIDFGRGFTIAEGIARPEDIRAILALPVEKGIALDIALKDAAAGDALPPRAMEGRLGCGLCGIEDISDAIRPVRPVDRSFVLAPEAVERAMAELPERQPINRVTHSVHAAAWCSPEGHVLLAREDVGRHCALDKLIGALAADGANYGTGFVLMTSRCSFELVQKAATAGIGHLATISAPTGFALDLARKLGLTLACRMRGGIMMFAA